MTYPPKKVEKTAFSFPKFKIFKQYINSVYQPSLKFTYLEYLKKLYAKELCEIQPNLLFNQELKENGLKLVHEGKTSDGIVGGTSTTTEDKFGENLQTDESTNNQPKTQAKIQKKRNIFKEFFRKEPQTTPSPDDDVDVDGFVWVKDPLQAKMKRLKWKIRKYFLQSPEQEEYNNKLDDFVVVEPEPKLKPKEEPLKEPQQINKFKESLIDFVAGSLGGVSQVYVSQPLDTVKVKLQTYPKLYSNMFTCLIHTYRQSGMRGLYAGTLPAVVASIAENSVLFTAYSGSQQLIAFIMEIDKVSELSTLGNACAGFFASFFSTFTLCPTELVKCKLQAVQEMKAYVIKDSKAPPITASNLTKHIYMTEGIPGFYRGLTTTFAREMPGVFLFFGGYEATRDYFRKPGQSKDDIGPLKTMCAGSVGGATLWTVTFPIDSIKSRIQINNLKESMFAVGLKIIRKEGFLSLYNGLLATLLRTIPSTATLFVVYEYTKKILNEMSS